MNRVWLHSHLVLAFLALLGQTASLNSTTPDPFQNDVKIEDAKKPKTNESRGILINTDSSVSTSSTALESVITFLCVFIVGCVITLSVYSWKKFKPSSWRMPVPYQYSALSQFDNDPDDDVVDPEHSLNMMVDDSTSDEEEMVRKQGTEVTSSKTIGAIDLDQPPDANAPATLPVSVTENVAPKTVGRKRSGSANLMEDSDRSSRHSSLTDDVFINNGGLSSLSNGDASAPANDDLMTR